MLTRWLTANREAGKLTIRMRQNQGDRQGDGQLVRIDTRATENGVVWRESLRQCRTLAQMKQTSRKALQDFELMREVVCHSYARLRVTQNYQA